jgi:hypothetical protein
MGTRTVILLVWVMVGYSTHGDVVYYFAEISKLFSGTPPSQILVEYPTPVVWLLVVPYLLGFATVEGYLAIFMVLMLSADAFLGYVLWKHARRNLVNPRLGALYWIWFVVAIGPIIYMRLDFLSAALAAGGLIALTRARGATSGAMFALGAATKLWPALLLPPALFNKGSRRHVGGGFLAAGLVLATASVVFAGWPRLFSPLTWQGDRGLHIESLAATALMIARSLDASSPRQWTVYLSRYNAWEITGPYTEHVMIGTFWGPILGGVLLGLLYVGWLSRTRRLGKPHTAFEAGTLMILGVFLLIATNKTFSPQYVIWLGGLVAVLLTLPRRGHADEALHHPAVTRAQNSRIEPLTISRRLVVWTLVLAALTQLIYPVLYRHYIVTSAMSPLALSLLVVRNLMVAIVTVSLAVYCWRTISFPPRGQRTQSNGNLTQLALEEPH